jgi:hypothetical protein
MSEDIKKFTPEQALQKLYETTRALQLNAAGHEVCKQLADRVYQGLCVCDTETTAKTKKDKEKV